MTPCLSVQSAVFLSYCKSTLPYRIDMCTVGDDSTCDSAQNEMCRTELGVSSCHCRPGYSRRKHREPCRSKSCISVPLTFLLGLCLQLGMLQ